MTALLNRYHNKLHHSVQVPYSRTYPCTLAPWPAILAPPPRPFKRACTSASHTNTPLLLSCPPHHTIPMRLTSPCYRQSVCRNHLRLPPRVRHLLPRPPTTKPRCCLHITRVAPVCSTRFRRQIRPMRSVCDSGAPGTDPDTDNRTSTIYMLPRPTVFEPDSA